MEAYDIEEEEVFVLRHNNKAQRSVNRQLRRAIKHFQNHTDELFLELCDTDKEAEVAMEKLWTLGGFNCGPRDYDYMIDRCVDAVSALAASNALDRCDFTLDH